MLTAQDTDAAADESTGRSGKKMKSSLTKNRASPTARVEKMGAHSETTPGASTLSRSQRGGDESSGTGVSPVRQASMIPAATDGSAFISKLRTINGHAAQETVAGTDVATKVASVTSTADDHGPVNKDVSKFPDASGVLDASPCAELTTTDVPLPHGRSRRKRRKIGARLSSSSASSASSRTSKQGATEGERKVKDTPSRSKAGGNVPRQALNT
ncbi:hypothetical protein MRX96_025567 [Rhipicephalus microplus]